MEMNPDDKLLQRLADGCPRHLSAGVALGCYMAVHHPEWAQAIGHAATHIMQTGPRTAQQLLHNVPLCSNPDDRGHCEGPDCEGDTCNCTCGPCRSDP